jgi:hypothetical protein
MAPGWGITRPLTFDRAYQPQELSLPAASRSISRCRASRFHRTSQVSVAVFRGNGKGPRIRGTSWVTLGTPRKVSVNGSGPEDGPHWPSASPGRHAPIAPEVWWAFHTAAARCAFNRNSPALPSKRESRRALCRLPSIRLFAIGTRSPGSLHMLFDRKPGICRLKGWSAMIKIGQPGT